MARLSRKHAAEPAKASWYVSTRPVRTPLATCRLHEHGAVADTRPQCAFVNDRTAARACCRRLRNRSGEISSASDAFSGLHVPRHHGSGGPSGSCPRAIDLDLLTLQPEDDGDFLFGRQTPLLLVPRGFLVKEMTCVGSHGSSESSRPSSSSSSRPASRNLAILSRRRGVMEAFGGGGVLVEVLRFRDRRVR